MKATRHNGRSGKHGTYDAKHNDRRFDVENSEHIDAERTKMVAHQAIRQDLKFIGLREFKEMKKLYIVRVIIEYLHFIDSQITISL